jgi:hypothetical protein
MTKYFNVMVSFVTESDQGKTKKQNIMYLVDANSVTEAEARTVRFLSSRGETNFEVKAAGESKVAEVITLN